MLIGGISEHFPNFDPHSVSSIFFSFIFPFLQEIEAFSFAPLAQLTVEKFPIFVI